MFILNQQQSIANHFLAELRDISVQKDRMRFRRNLERLGEIMAYEISKEMEYEVHTFRTPLTTTIERLLQHQPIVIPILRAAMPFFQGILNVITIQQAAMPFTLGILNAYEMTDCGFVDSYRKEHEAEIEIEFG